MLLYSVVHKEMIDINTSTVNIWTPEYSKHSCKEHSLYGRMYVIYASPTLVSLSTVSFRKAFFVCLKIKYTHHNRYFTVAIGKRLYGVYMKLMPLLIGLWFMLELSHDICIACHLVTPGLKLNFHP
jgi:hypothetical protein